MGLYNRKPVVQLCGCHDLYYDRQGIRSQTNSDSLRGVFNSDRSPFKSRLILNFKRKPPPPKTHIYLNCIYHKDTKADLKRASMKDFCFREKCIFKPKTIPSVLATGKLSVL